MKRLILVTLVILGLSGCATYAWQKPGVSVDVAQRDAQECDRQAQAIASDYTFWAWSQAPYGFYGAPWHWGPAAPMLAPNPGWQMDVAQRARDRCMEVKGYTLVKQPKKPLPAS